jgi:hypothetical protein
MNQAQEQFYLSPLPDIAITIFRFVPRAIHNFIIHIP